MCHPLIEWHKRLSLCKVPIKVILFSNHQVNKNSIQHTTNPTLHGQVHITSCVPSYQVPSRPHHQPIIEDPLGLTTPKATFLHPKTTKALKATQTRLAAREQQKSQGISPECATLWPRDELIEYRMGCDVLHHPTPHHIINWEHSK